jgi:plasmid stability protein
MNVTLKLPDDLVRQARIRAVHQSESLSAWMADLVRRELSSASDSTEPEAPSSLFEAMQVPGMPDWFYEKELPLPDRKADQEREVHFEPEEP